MQQAYLLEPRAALEAVSWGKFQILGSNYVYAGFSCVEMFVSAMCYSEQSQLQAFVAFIRAKGLSHAFAVKDFAAIAAGYNGSRYYAEHYDVKLEAIYEQLQREQ